MCLISKVQKKPVGEVLGKSILANQPKCAGIEPIFTIYYRLGATFTLTKTYS